MQKSIHLEEFNGPLDLLLQLIENKELEITKVAIAEVAEQFLQYLDEVEERSPEELADFLVVATQLLLLKSQALLPYLQMDEEEDVGDLEAQLRMYKKYLDATKVIYALYMSGLTLFPKNAKPMEVVFRPDPHVNAGRLKAFFEDVLGRLEPVVKLPNLAVATVMTLREKFCQIQEMLEKKIKLNFQDLLSGNGDRGEVVITFLALLELIKKQSICVVQDKPMADITIEKM